MSAVGESIGGKYVLLRLLGAGGMGQVFEARNQNTGRRVAIKVLLPEYARDPEVVQRFLKEARAATSIRHPNVVDILDFDTDPVDGRPYLVQEFLVGESLDAYLAAEPGNKLPVHEALRVLLPVLSAMAAAHRLNIVHRDLKPGNIFLARDAAGELVVKVIDFGIARHDATLPDGQGHTAADQRFRTRTGSIIGTPAYMSPEQASGAPDVDARTDVWALGVILYELLTGRLPYDAPNVNLLIGKLLYEAPTPIQDWDRSLPPGVVQLVECAVHRDRTQRFPSAAEMYAVASSRDLLDDVTTVMASYDPSGVPGNGSPSRAPKLPRPSGDAVPSLAVSSPPSLSPWESVPRQARRAPQRRWGRAIAAVALMVVGVAGAVLSLRSRSSTPVAPSHAAAAAPIASTAPAATGQPTRLTPPTVVVVAHNAGAPHAARAAPPGVPTDTPAQGPTAAPSTQPAAHAERHTTGRSAPRTARPTTTPRSPPEPARATRSVQFDSEYP